MKYKVKSSTIKTFTKILFLFFFRNRGTSPGSLLIAEKFNCRVWNNPSAVSSIAFEQSSKSLSSPNIPQALNGSIILNVMRILDLVEIRDFRYNIKKHICFYTKYCKYILDKCIYNYKKQDMLLTSTQVS